MSLAVRDVSVVGDGVELVSHVTLSVEPSKPLTLLGETGSGKSLLAQAIVGTVPRGLSLTGQPVTRQHGDDVEQVIDAREDMLHAEHGVVHATLAVGPRHTRGLRWSFDDE